uniref:THAP4-like heme-binding domain-containing protein n=1 Tax=Meloidogyne enterolobii TaxID=390850 RepID=A0A6V7WZ09_MELEN|nr:unnamed protein product [Meloidogyne enterolobii]
MRRITIILINFVLFFISLFLFSLLINAELSKNNEKISWIVGKWRSEFSGKVVWPSIPTMTFGEELNIQEAPMAGTSGVQFLNWRWEEGFLFIKFLDKFTKLKTLKIAKKQ